MSYSGNGQTSFARKKPIGFLKAAIIIGGAGFLAMAAYMSQPTATYKAEAETMKEIVTVDTSAEMYAGRIEALKDQVVAELEKCESGGFAADKGIIIFDTNNKASIGPLQMQKDHVIHYAKKLEGRDITGQEAVITAITPEKARPFAKRVLFEVEDGWKEWYNCGVKYGLGTKIEYIKKLEAGN